MSIFPKYRRKPRLPVQLSAKTTTRPTWDSNPESSANSVPETDALTIRPVGRRQPNPNVSPRSADVIHNDEEIDL